jgi:monoamine oxidase
MSDADRIAQLEAALKAAETALARSHESHAARIAMDSEHFAQLEAENKAMRAALTPFDRAASEMFCRNWNDTDVAFEMYGGPRQQSGRVAVRLTAADFFAVRRTLSTTASKGGE